MFQGYNTILHCHILLIKWLYKIFQYPVREIYYHFAPNIFCLYCSISFVSQMNKINFNLINLPNCKHFIGITIIYRIVLGGDLTSFLKFRPPTYFICLPLYSSLTFYSFIGRKKFLLYSNLSILYFNCYDELNHSFSNLQTPFYNYYNYGYW